ncbi:tetratricopeptide repeat protein [Spartinivicinus ruber]|uniref:tetratricopeptide repeat protein n=1 Tax=Spartinivicinus ruber TaxID=2683272 RepID=UPI0013CF6754|nr:sel1 repeat family protein [Spartinivicinus ruber]
MNQDQLDIIEVEKVFEAGDIEGLKKLLPPLLERNIPEAIRINASFFDSDIPEEECERLFVEGMFRAAKLGDPKARYQVGVFYDLGEYGIKEDKYKASLIFKKLAEEGDPHCMWIYACELIWGNGSFPKSFNEGIQLLMEASERGSANACMTIAGFYDEGQFRFEKNIEKRDKYRALALVYDDTTFDPYAKQIKAPEK